MQPTPKKAAPTKASLQKRAAQGAKPAAKAPVVPLTPEELKQQQAREAALKARGNAWQQDPKLTAREKELGLYTTDKYGNIHKDPDLINRESADPAVRDVVQLCKTKTRNKLVTVQCVPAVNSTRLKIRQEVIDYTVADQQAKRGVEFKLKADYTKLVGWEGGSYTQGYVPWGLQLKVLEENVGTKEKAVLRQTVSVVTTRRTLEGKSVLKGDKAGGKSGVTIGSGVDIGQQTDVGFRRQLKAATRYSKEKRFDYDEAKATALADKLKPYMNLKLTEACAKLIKDPLTLTSEEIDFMNYQAFMSHTNEAIDNYETATGKKWSDLETEEQTAILGYVYQVGSMPTNLYKNFADYNKEKVLAAYKKRREYSYIKKFYDNDTNSERARAREAAKQAAAKGQKLPASQPPAKPVPKSATTAPPVATPANAQPKARIQLGTTTAAPATRQPAASSTATTPANPPAASGPAATPIYPTTSPSGTTPNPPPVAPAHPHPYKQNEYREQIKNHDQRGPVVPQPSPPTPDSTHAAGAVAPLSTRAATPKAKLQYPPVPARLPTRAVPTATPPSRYPPPPATPRSAPTSSHPQTATPSGSPATTAQPATSSSGTARLHYPTAGATRPATGTGTAAAAPKAKPRPAARPASEHMSRGALQRQLKPRGSDE